MSEQQAFAAVRTLTDDHVRKSPTSKRWRMDDKPEVHPLVTWLRCVPEAEKWWRSAAGWRAPREFNGWRDVEGDSPHLEPFEIAQMRLPEDVVMDADVVLLQAWCQGMTYKPLAKALEGHETWGQWSDCVRAGLMKLHRSPFVQLAIAAPWLPPMGIDLGPGLIASAVRIEVLKKHPYTASVGELELLFRSPMVHSALAKASQARKKGKFVNPDGGWYACNSASALGTWFRRGARWTATSRDAK